MYQRGFMGLLGLLIVAGIMLFLFSRMTASTKEEAKDTAGTAIEGGFKAIQDAERVKTEVEQRYKNSPLTQ